MATRKAYNLSRGFFLRYASVSAVLSFVESFIPHMRLTNQRPKIDQLGLFVGLVIGLWLLSSPAHVAAQEMTTDTAQETYPDSDRPLDPSYAELLSQAEGKVYDMRSKEGQGAFEQSLNHKETHSKSSTVNQSIAVYVFLKWTAYTLWCWLGGVWLSRRSKPSFMRILAWGTLRAILGVTFGAAAFFFMVLLLSYLRIFMIRHPYILYLMLYVPIRWMEWGIMTLLIEPRDTGRAFWTGGNYTSAAWRGGGILVSCLLDWILVSAFGGLIPLGRFMC